MVFVQTPASKQDFSIALDDEGYRNDEFCIHRRTARCDKIGLPSNESGLKPKVKLFCII